MASQNTSENAQPVFHSPEAAALVEQLSQERDRLQAEVTELRADNQRQRQAKGRYRQIFENAPISMVLVNRAGYVMEINAAAEGLYGLTAEQLNQQACPIFENRQLMENGTLPYMQRALAGEAVVEPPTCYDASRDFWGGNFNYGRGHYAPIWDETGNVEGFVEIAADYQDFFVLQAELLQGKDRTAAELTRLNAQLQQTLEHLEARDRILQSTAMTVNKLLTTVDLDTAVNSALQTLGEALEADRTAVIEHATLPLDDSCFPTWRLLYEWQAPGVVSQMAQVDLAEGTYEGIEDWYEQLVQGQGISCRLEDMAEPFRSGQAKLGVKVLHVVPIFVEGKLWGVVGFDDCREVKHRSPTELMLLKTAATCIGNAIQRDRTQQALLQAEQNQVAKLAKANQALKQALVLLAQEPSLDKLLGHVLRAMVDQLDKLSGGVYLYNATEQRTVLHLNYEGGALSCDRPTCGEDRPDTAFLRAWDDQYLPLLRQNQVLIHREPEFALPAYDAYRARNAELGIKTLTFVPMLFGEELLGIITLRCRHHYACKPEDLELVRALTHQATLAVQLTRLVEEAKQAAILNERNAVAREIHDTLAQAFGGILMQLQAADYFFSRRPEGAHDHINTAQQLARDGLTAARQTVWLLYQGDLEYQNLAVLVPQVVDQLNTNAAIPLALEVIGKAYDIEPDVGVNLVRILQEAVNNGLRHAQAEEIHIRLVYEPGRILLAVSDDGIGFDPQEPRSGFGLTGMQQRAEHLNAQLKIDSRRGEGTQIQVVVPITACPTGRVI